MLRRALRVHSMYIQNEKKGNKTPPSPHCFLITYATSTASVADADGSGIFSPTVERGEGVGGGASEDSEKTSALERHSPSALSLLLTYSGRLAFVEINLLVVLFICKGAGLTWAEPGRECAGSRPGGRAAAQLRVRMVFSNSGLRRAGLFPPAAAMSACTAASQENDRRAAGTRLASARATSSDSCSF